MVNYHDEPRHDIHCPCAASAAELAKRLAEIAQIIETGGYIGGDGEIGTDCEDSAGEHVAMNPDDLACIYQLAKGTVKP